MTLTVDTLAAQLSGEVRGDGSVIISAARSLDKSSEGDIAFVADEAHGRNLKNCRASALLVGHVLSESPFLNDLPQTILIVSDAKRAFLEILTIFQPPRPRAGFGISSRAIVHPTAQVGFHTNIHPGAHIAEDVVIGEYCDVYPGVYVGPGCRIGDHAVLHPNVVLYQDVILGRRVVLHAGVVIGADGFGYQLVDGAHQRLPHFGTVRIEDDVEIGANTTVDRALVGETVIGKGTKIDNLVMVAHNCELGQHNLLASQVGFAGSVTTGKYVVCAGQVGVADHVHIGEKAVLGAQSGVPKSLPGGKTYLGSPALPDSESHKHFMASRRLPQMREQLRVLAADVKTMQSQIDSLMNSNRPTDGDVSEAA